MSGCKRVLWALVLTAIASLLPGTAFSVEEDPYIYRVLFARVYFEFEKTTKDENGSETDSSSFNQTYTLDTLGNILSRRILIYDAGMSFSDTSSESNTSSSGSDTVSYYLRTTILPKSSIPLTLYGSQTTSTTTSSVSETERVKSDYGLMWFLNLRKLPKTRVSIARARQETSTSNQVTTSYKLTMHKQVGPSDNNFFYDLNTSEDEVNSGNDTMSSSVNFTNRTNLSRSTTADIGLSRGEVENEDPASADSTVQGMTLGLDSKPSKEFSQNHRYNYYSSESGDSNQTGETYAGSISYELTEALNSSLGISISENESESPTSTQESSSSGYNFSLNYRASRKLTLSENLSYSVSETTSDIPSNIREREILRAFTSASYRDNLEWAMLGTNYGVGYREETADGISNAGVEQGFGVGLGSIDLTKYAIFNTAFSWSEVDSLKGETWSSSRGYEVSATSRLWERYARLMATYKKTNTSSWIEILNRKTESFRFDAVSNYFRNTKIEFYSEHINNTDETSGVTQVDVESLRAIHSRLLMGGSLSMTADYTLTDSTSADTSNSSTTTTLTANYRKMLLRRLSWNLAASVVSSTTNGTQRDSTSLTNSLIIPLRSWLFTAEHKYLSYETSSTERTENRLLFRLTRSFVRFL